MLLCSLLLVGCGRIDYDLTSDAATADGGPVSSADAGSVDADASVFDAGPLDGGAPDAALSDSGTDAALQPVLDCRLEVPLDDRDTDDDGILDLFDDDDDGDGLADATECGWGTATLVVNGGFELPEILPEGRGFNYYPEEQVPGWSAVVGNTVELWESGHEGVSAVAGAQFAELQPEAYDGLLQDLSTPSPMTLRWALQHRGRHGTETMELSFAEPAASPVRREVLTTPQGVWVVHHGTYVVPAGQAITRLQLLVTSGPVSTGGNLVDEVVVQPICEVDSDGDGCVDSEDRDSDNDGVPDA